jgi:Uncharacterized protein conserved in bacteria
LKGALLAALARLLYMMYQELRFRFYFGPIFHRFLNHKYSYYTRLPWSLKMKFLRLAKHHYQGFEFVSRDKLKATRAMKSIICSAAAQLTLFLPKESLNYFTKIILYQDFYSSRITRQWHKGEVNPGMKLMVFSWRGVMEGLKRKTDGVNLLLHEFAHALWLEQKLVSQYDVFDQDAVKAFEHYAHAEMKNLQADENHFFRPYAFENMEEFFAVAVENFFERPSKFKEAQPELYLILAQIFKQDPLQLYASRTEQKSIFR